MADEGNVWAREAGDKEANNLWRAWRTVHEMVRDRGYELADEEITISLQDFKSKFMNDDGQVSRNNLYFSARPTGETMENFREDTKPGKRPMFGTIYVSFLNESNIGIKHMRDFISKLGANHYHTGILVTMAAATPSALKLLVPALQEGLKVECFVEEELLVNITHHELVPRHTVLSGQEKIKLLQRYRLKETQLPRIQQKDPMARYLGLSTGQVVKIIRVSETAGRYASYRLCVQSRG